MPEIRNLDPCDLTTFNEHTAHDKIIVLSAVDCGPCRTIKSSFRSLANHRVLMNTEIFFCEFDLAIGDHQELVQQLGLRFWPTALHYIDGICVAKMRGVLPSKTDDKNQALIRWIEGGRKRHRAPTNTHHQSI